MSEYEQYEIDLVKSAVSNVYGNKLSTSNDFSDLSEDVVLKTRQAISESTLKRIWGYVNYHPKPNASTLNILARYAGYASMKDLYNSKQVSSGFFGCEMVASSDLNPEDRVLLGWSPDREVTLIYKGDSHFLVMKSGTSKLRKGDRIVVSEFIKGVPLFLGRVLREGVEPFSYVAGKAMGINKLEVLVSSPNRAE